MWSGGCSKQFYLDQSLGYVDENDLVYWRKMVKNYSMPEPGSEACLLNTQICRQPCFQNKSLRCLSDTLRQEIHRRSCKTTKFASRFFGHKPDANYQQVVAAGQSLSHPLVLMNIDCHYSTKIFVPIVCTSHSLETCVWCAWPCDGFYPTLCVSGRNPVCFVFCIATARHTLTNKKSPSCFSTLQCELRSIHQEWACSLPCYCVLFMQNKQRK